MWNHKSKLFRRIARKRKVNNMENKLESNLGEILDLEDKIVEEVVKFFCNLYNEGGVEVGIGRLDWFPVK